MDNLEKLHEKIDRNHAAVMGAISALAETVSVQAQKTAAHSGACDTDRVNLHDVEKRTAEELEELEKKVDEIEKSINKLTLKIIAIGTAVAAGGTGAIELVKSFLGG